jgi:pyruvate dehydrogenase E2 component (dihydrolipoamide acetyltransferase)
MLAPVSDPSATGAEVIGAKGATRVEEPSAAERMVARRAAEARATIPDLELRTEVDMARCLALRERRHCSLTAMLVRACALSLREVPRANGAYRDGRFELYSRINVGVVVADEHVYAIPAVFDADQKSVTELTTLTDELAVRGRERSLSPSTLSGATFTLWNVGALGVESSTMVINPPQAAAMSAGAVREVPVIRDGAVVGGHSMALTLACDHRILYGAQAARFLAAVKSKLEDASV